MKRIILYSHDPGGANTIIPLVAPLRERGYDVLLYGNGPALEKYRQAGVPGLDLQERIAGLTPGDIGGFLQQQRPDFLITGTSAENFTEKYLWHAAAEQKIPSFAILDQWLNYGIRFSSRGLSQSDGYEASPDHPYVPSKVIVMDDYAQDEMSRLGILPRERILPLGQPHFEALRSKAHSLPQPGELRNRLGLPAGEFLVTYVSEPLTLDYGDDPDDGRFWGFTERTIFRSLRGVLAGAARQTGRAVRLLVKLHPREKAHNYDGLLESPEPLLTISLDRTADSLELIYSSDLICGMSSMMLIEAAIVGRPVASILIGLRRESPFILDRRGIIRSLRSEADLEQRFLRELGGEKTEPARFEVVPQPVRSIIEEMERMLL